MAIVESAQIDQSYESWQLALHADGSATNQAQMKRGVVLIFIITPEWNGKDFNDIDKIYSVGKYEIKKNKVIITELPIGIWTDPYKEYLESIINDSSNKKNYIESYKSKSTDIEVDFEITFKQDILNKLLENKELETVLKLKESKNGKNDN